MKTAPTSWLTSLAILSGLAVTARSAGAQTSCQGSSGPDVMAGDIQQVANYNASGGLEALSLGTTSCNLGTVWVNWIANTNQHPVISGNLYRFKVVDGAGRFEQVGLSWPKHTFFALSGTVCCTSCSADFTGAHLGVGCSDVNSAMSNGTQGEMGPRYQVDAYTGVFTYPPPHPSGGNTGRLEVSISDLEPSNPSGTRYFGECQYVAADDAAAGHQNNNASYRELALAGSGTSWNFTLTGSTQRETQAIRAWPIADPGVSERDIQIPSEGLLILACKTTQLGGGQHHYEYAVHNMNSDLGVGSFSLPVPSWVGVTNIGFHDVTYRGGDGVGGIDQDGTDWLATRTGGTLTWASRTFAQDPNANAIRWGTTYNFRFDANTPPTTGTITIGTFKDGGSVQTTADMPSGPPGTSFCPGDGSLPTACPCGNSGGSGRGCANSQNASGAVLTSGGSVSPDTVVLTSSGELPGSLSIFVQGALQNPGGIVFGDGVRCVTGPLKRLYVKSASGGVAIAPGSGDPSITSRSAALGDPISPGSTRHYQTYYRDANPGFCPDPPGNTFNISSGQIVVW